MIKLSNLLKEWSAQEVINQLGGNKFVAMTGAKAFVQDKSKKQLGFKIGKNSKGINYVRITLNGNDTYDVEFIKIRGMDVRVVAKHNDVYNDELQKIFTKETGMHTRL